MGLISWLRRWLRNWLFRPAKPGWMYVITGEAGMGNALRLKVSFPPLAEGEAGEVVARKLTTVVNGGVPNTVDITVEQTDYTFDVVQDDIVKLSLVNIDDAGNISLPSTREFTALDTVPPAAPGELGVEVSEVPPAPVE